VLLFVVLLHWWSPWYTASLHQFAFDMSMGPGRTFFVSIWCLLFFVMVVVGVCCSL
jgi:hypothetical protein